MLFRVTFENGKEDTFYGISADNVRRGLELCNLKVKSIIEIGAVQ